MASRSQEPGGGRHCWFHDVDVDSSEPCLLVFNNLQRVWTTYTHHPGSGFGQKAMSEEHATSLAWFVGFRVFCWDQEEEKNRDVLALLMGAAS